MASSNVEICNIALARVGQAAITALTGTGKSSVLCNTLYTPSLDEALERWDWNCARHQGSLTADTTAPTHTWDYRYALPSSPYCLKLLSVKDTGGNDVEYELQGRYILCDIEDGLYITYVKRVSNVAEMSAHLTKVVSLLLAHALEPSFGDSRSRRESILLEIKEVIKLAKQHGAAQDYSKDEEEKGSDTTGTSEWVSSGR